MFYFATFHDSYFSRKYSHHSTKYDQYYIIAQRVEEVMIRDVASQYNLISRGIVVPRARRDKEEPNYTCYQLNTRKHTRHYDLKHFRLDF
jgi:hypothetical protein